MTHDELTAIRDRDRAWETPLRTVADPEELGQAVAQMMKDRHALLAYVDEMRCELEADDREAAT